MPVNTLFSTLEFSDDIEVREEAVAEILRQANQSPLDLREALNVFPIQADEDQLAVMESDAQSIRVIAAANLLIVTSVSRQI